MKYNKNKSAINFIIQKTEDNIKKYKEIMEIYDFK